MSGRPFRVIALTHVFPRWDDDPSAAFLGMWARAIRDAGHDVRVIAPHDARLPEVDVVAGTPVRRVRYAADGAERLAYRGEMHRIALRPPFGPGLLGAFGVEMAAALRRAVRRWRPDVVHVHWWLPGAVIARTARVDVPLVVHLHGTDVGLVESRPPLAGLARWALEPADRIDVVSTSLADRAAAAIGVEAHGLNPMPIDLDAITPVAPVVSLDRPVVLGVGRLVPEKGFRDLVEAVAGLRRPVRLRIVGDGPDEVTLRGLAATRGVDLELPGRIPQADLAAEYAAADVVVQPSHAEGFGLVAAEAVLMGRPLVATDSGGVRDLVERQLLVRPGDIGMLRARIVEALEDPDLPAVVRAAKRVRQTLNPDAAVSRTVDAWHAAIAGHHAGR
ncbi:glycosyltransferase [Euzebya sp.]|uniref:glycosyltransferase n=1 Tax=Euzebya sp. TaxID=1971409 RepID=UPI0035179E09